MTRNQPDVTEIGANRCRHDVTLGENHGTLQEFPIIGVSIPVLANTDITLPNLAETDTGIMVKPE